MRNDSEKKTPAVVKTTCAICGKPLVGKPAGSSLASFMAIWKSNQIAWRCTQCDAYYCFQTHEKELNIGIYSKSRCPQCQRPFRADEMLLKLANVEQEKFAESTEAAHHPQAVIPASKERTATLGLCCPKCGASTVESKYKREWGTGHTVMLIMGVTMLLGGLLLATMTPHPSDSHVGAGIIGILTGSWILWDILSGRPIRVLGITIKLFKEKWYIQACCLSCEHKWREPYGEAS